VATLKVSERAALGSPSKSIERLSMATRSSPKVA